MFDNKLSSFGSVMVKIVFFRVIVGVIKIGIYNFRAQPHTIYNYHMGGLQSIQMNRCGPQAIPPCGLGLRTQVDLLQSRSESNADP